MGDCDSNDQCKENLRCGSNNCLDSFGFNAHTDCCFTAIVGDDDFCSTDEPCDVNEGDCDSDDECKSNLFCGSNNCPDSLRVLSSIDCCEPKGDKTLCLSIAHIILILFIPTVDRIMCNELLPRWTSGLLCNRHTKIYLCEYLWTL